MTITKFTVSNLNNAIRSTDVSGAEAVLTREVRLMYRQHCLPTTGQSAVAATRRRWPRRMLVAVAACVLGLLPGVPGLAPAGSAAVPPASSGSKDYRPNLIVHSTGAPDEQLDVAAALDQGARLFLLQARYRDAGNGQADYYLAGPRGVSHQPLRALFAPLGTWLAAPGHEHEMIMLGLLADPRSANPARFDAACQAFASTLGPYLLKVSDLPAGKSLAELTPTEQAALRSRPRVATDWSACTGEAQPIARPQPRPAAAVPVEDHWMANQKDTIGQRPLRQVVIPGSHDAATYEYDSSCRTGECWPMGPVEEDYTQAQSQDVTAQLNAGSRYFDLRFSYYDWLCNGCGEDFYAFHGTDANGDPNASFLKMSKVLSDIDSWINQPGHEREIVWLGMEVYREDQDQSQSKAICDATLGQELAQGKVIQSSMLPPNTALTDMSMNEIWALPGQPQIIVTGWSSCTGNDPMTSGGAYADMCWGNNVWSTIYPELLARTDWSTKKRVTGAYTLDIQSTPYGSDGCSDSIRELAPQQINPLSGLKSFVDFPTGPSSVAWANLNVVAGDFLGDPDGEGDGNWPIVQTALTLNQDVQSAALSWTKDLVASVTVSCKPLRPTGPGPTTMVVYAVMQGPQSPNLKTFTPDQSGSLQGTVSLNDFPGAGVAPDGNYLVAACAQGGSPLDPPGSSGAQISRVVIPLSAFGALPLLGATPADGVDLSFTCFGSGPQVQVTAYPAAAGPNSPDAQTFDAPGGQSTLQATYSRRANYDVRVDCRMSGVTNSLTVPARAFPPALTMRADPKDRWLYCDRDPQLTSPATLSLAAQTPNAPAPLSKTSERTVVLNVQPDYFPPVGDYQLTATCASSDTPPFTATPVSLSSSQIPMHLRATPSSGLQLAITCGNLNPQEANGIHIVAAGPNNQDAQTWDGAGFTLQETYSRQADYDVTVDCTLGGISNHTLTAPANAFPPPLTIRKGGQRNVSLYCDRDQQLTSPATLSLAAQTANAPPALSITGTGKDSGGTIILPVRRDYFPNGDYQLTATCASSDAPSFTATPLTLSSSQIPTGGTVTAEITGCSTQGGNTYDCALQVTLGPPLGVNTVFSVGIGGGGFANPSGGDKPQVTAIQDCQVPPLPSTYLADGNGGYTRYDVNIGPGGCTAGAVMTFGEAVTGAAGATITQPVTVPGLDASTATFVLPPAARAGTAAR